MKVSATHKTLRIFLWVLLAISVVIAGIFVGSLSGAETREAEMAAATPMLVWTYCLLGLGALLAVVFPLIYIVRNPKKAVKALVSLAFLGVIVLVAYALSSSEPIVTATSGLNKNFSDPTVLRVAGTGIYTTYILFGISILLLVVTGVRGIFKNV